MTKLLQRKLQFAPHIDLDMSDQDAYEAFDRAVEVLRDGWLLNACCGLAKKGEEKAKFSGCQWSHKIRSDHKSQTLDIRVTDSPQESAHIRVSCEGVGQVLDAGISRHLWEDDVAEVRLYAFRNGSWTQTILEHGHRTADDIEDQEETTKRHCHERALANLQPVD